MNNNIKIENNRQRINTTSNEKPSFEQQQENEKNYKKQMQHFVVDCLEPDSREIEYSLNLSKGLNHSGSFILNDDIKKDEQIIFGEKLKNIGNIKNFETEKSSFISILKNGSTTVNKLAYYSIIKINYNQYASGCRYFGEKYLANEYQFDVVRKIVIDFENLEKCNQINSKINTIQIISSNLCYADSSRVYDDKLICECEYIFKFMLDSKLLIKHKNYRGIEYYESHLIHYYNDELIKKFNFLYDNDNDNNNNNYNQIKYIDKFQSLTSIIKENKICLIDTNFCEESYFTQLMVNYNGYSFINFEQNCSKYIVIEGLIQDIKKDKKKSNSFNNLMIITNNLINVKDIYNLITRFDEICEGVKKITIFFDSIDNTNLSFFAKQLFKQKKCALIGYSTKKFDTIHASINDVNISLDDLCNYEVEEDDDDDNNYFNSCASDSKMEQIEKIKHFILEDKRLKIETDFDIYNIISEHIKSSTNYTDKILCSDNSNFEQFFNSYFYTNNIIDPNNQLPFNSLSFFNEENGCFRDKTIIELKENFKEKGYNEKNLKLIIPFNSFSTRTKSIIYFTSELKLENVYSIMKKCKYDVIVYIISKDKYFY